MSAIITLFNCRASVRIAKGVASCHDGALAGLWSPTRTILCADRTSNAIGDLRSSREGVLIMYAANGNTGSVGAGSRMSFGGIVRHDGGQ